MKSLLKPGGLVTVAAGLVLVVSACGSDGGSDSSGQTAEQSGAGKAKPTGEKIPAALAANRAQANEILDEGSLKPKLDELKGHPVVVNQWASWCEPCRAEFPFFRDSAEAHADRIAFLGIDMQDERSAAEDFLDEIPVSYPSIFDPSAEQIASLGGAIVSPTTAFIDEQGEVVGLFQGGYATREMLEADIDRYLPN
ncbi:MAG: TlpA family protein disulfide reductase [Thermoleophilia bacterium]|nr:TlpA family protein disulfide reductase [Thermoleophilia bacterium]